MPASLLAPDAPAPSAAPAAGWCELCPAAAPFLRRCGLSDADSVMDLSGEVVSGHPDRHVRRVVLTDGRDELVGYLKREHTASVRAKLGNLIAGAGWVSRCEREARVLAALHARGLPAPRPLAWGVDGRGRAFLLVAELAGAADLPRYLERVRGFGSVACSLRGRIAGPAAGAVGHDDRRSPDREGGEQAQRPALPVSEFPSLTFGATTDNSRPPALPWALESARASDGQHHRSPGHAAPADRRRLAEALGRSLAAVHAAGVTTPDLAAKHVFVGPDSVITLLDWQGSTVGPGPRPVAVCVRPLATLDASLRADLAGPRDRLRVVRAYLKHRNELGRFKTFVRQVRAAARGRSERSSVRDGQTGPSLRLVWLADEAACAVPAAVPHWPAPADGRPFYPGPPDGHAAAEEAVDLGGPAAGVVVRFRSAAPLGRLLACLRERPWRSPGAEAARLLAHLARHGVPAPELLGFGQKLLGPVRADSFVFFDPPAGCAPAAVALCRAGGDLAARRALLADCGRLVRRVHDARLRLRTAPTGRAILTVGPDGQARVGSPFVVRRAKKLAAAGRRADLRLLFTSDLAALSRPDRLRVVRGYVGAGGPVTPWLRGVV